MSTYVTFPVQNASDMCAYISKPQGKGPFPAIMVFQEAYGVNHYIREITDRIAAEGYFAIAPELFHRTAPAHFEGNYSDFSSVQPHTSVITTETLEADVHATYKWLSTQNDVIKDKIGCIGFCLGGRVSFIANSILPLKAAVSFYAGNMHTVLDRATQLHAPQLFFWGGKDQHIKPEHVAAVIAAIRAAGKEFTNVEISYGDHGFFRHGHATYNEAAASEAWGMARVFLQNKLGQKLS